jgi:hypothetical protein
VRVCLSLTVCVLVALTASRAWAQPADGQSPVVTPAPTPAAPPAAPPAPPTVDKQAATVQYDEGQRKFAAGDDYLGAAADFEAAYALDPDPAYLYNIAQAYRLGSACAKAADYYRRFLAVVPNPPNLDKVNHYLDELDACAKAESSAVDTPVVVTPPPVIVPVAKPIPPRDPAIDSGLRFKRRLGISIGVAGVAALAVGAWFTHDVHTLEGYSSAICASGTACTWDSSKQSRAEDLDRRGDRATHLSIGLYAGGAAAILGGAVLYVLGDREPHEQAVSIVPLQGGAAALARFEF